MKHALIAVAFLATLIGTPDAQANEWTTAQTPFRIHGNTWYVGSKGLSAILITTDKGHVLIDVPMAENVPTIEANIRQLGFRIEDIKYIVNTHAHFDHAGGIAALASDSGAVVLGRAAQAHALLTGGDDADDPQHGSASLYAPVPKVNTLANGEALKLGSLRLQAHPTPGHTPGSTSWSWRSCEDGHCLNLVYADSLSALTAGDYRYSDPAHPERLRDFRRGLKRVAALRCDLLITPHPEASGFWARLQRRDAGEHGALVDSGACRAYAEAARQRLADLVVSETRAAQQEAQRK